MLAARILLSSLFEHNFGDFVIGSSLWARNLELTAQQYNFIAKLYFKILR